MIISAKLEMTILKYTGELYELVNLQGYELTNPIVVNKSMELDVLILEAMRCQNKRFQQTEAS